MAKEDTPMMKHFFSVKAQYPEAILLYRVGDFYETYSDDAIIASKVLGIVQTKRSNGNNTGIPMAGFPHHAIESYLPRLVKAGYKVAVCDQVENPALAGKKLVQREVTELVTPGVAFSEQLLEQKEHNYLACIFSIEKNFGAAFLDVSTGSFQITQGSFDYINNILSALKPKEIVIPRELKKSYQSLFGDKYYYSTLDQWCFVQDAAEDKLKKQLNIDSLKAYAIEKYPLGISAAGAILVYLEQTQHSGLKNICAISRIDEGRFVWMDKFTMKNLELFSSNDNGTALINIIDRCSSPMGARMLRQWLALPLIDIEEIAFRHNLVENFYNNQDNRIELQKLLSSMGDLERIISRVATARINPKELLQLARGLSLIPQIIDLCKQSNSPSIDKLLAKIVDCNDLVNNILKSIDPDTAISIGKGKVIASAINTELDELRSLANGGKAYLNELQARESERTGISSLKIGYNNVFGYYLEVRNTHKDNVPEEWIRKQTLVNAERYITAELKEYEDKILGAEEKIYQIEAEIYNALIQYAQGYISTIQTNTKILAELDIVLGFAELAQSNNYTRPIMNEGYGLELIESRHPVIETLMKAGEEYIANDIILDKDNEQIIILTGPNMAGKSALLRQSALIIILAQIGSFVPAKKATIGYFDKIFTRVGASDNISKGESTFMVEMLESSMILHNLSQRSLVLLDEIGRGTSTYDGMSIAKAIVEYIHNYGKGAKTLFATHYHELNELENQYDRIHNYHIAVKEMDKKVIFLRKLLKGGTAHSFGIHVARMAGMPKEVLKAAEENLKQLEQAHSQINLYGDKISSSRDNKSGTNTDFVRDKDKKKNTKEENNIQLSLFQLDDPTLSSLKERLRKVDINQINPLQAFDLIREMRKELGMD